LKKKIIFTTVGILCLLLIVSYFFIPSEKSRWQDINDQVTIFRNQRQKSFADINRQASQTIELVKAFREKFPDWRTEDVKLLTLSIDTLSTEKYILIAQEKLEHILTHHASFQEQKDSMLLLFDSLKVGLYSHGSLGFGSNIISKVEDKINIAKFNIDWGIKLSSIDSIILTHVEESWDMSSLATNRGLLRPAPIYDIAIVEKIITKEADSPDQKRYVYRIKATAEATVAPHIWSFSENVYDLIFDGMVYCEGKANTSITSGTVGNFKIQYKQKGTKRVV